MNLKRCQYCGKHFQKLNESNRCIECESQYNTIALRVIKRHEIALKELGKR